MIGMVSWGERGYSLWGWSGRRCAQQRIVERHELKYFRLEDYFIWSLIQGRSWRFLWSQWWLCSWGVSWIGTSLRSTPIIKWSCWCRDLCGSYVRELQVMCHRWWSQRRYRGRSWRRWDPLLSESSWSGCTSAGVIAAGRTVFYWLVRNCRDWSQDRRGVVWRWWSCLMGLMHCRRHFLVALMKDAPFLDGLGGE